MRVLIVHDYAPPLGGAEVMNTTLTRTLRERGHEVRRFHSTAALDQWPSSDADVDYRCLGTTSQWRTLLQTANPWAAAALRRALADFRPDVVHLKIFLTQLSPLILPVLRQVPTLYHAVWYRAVCPTGQKMLPNGESCTVRAGRPCLENGCLPLRDWGVLMAQRAMFRRWRHHLPLTVANSRWTASMLAAEGIAPLRVVQNGVPVVAARPPLGGDPFAVYAGRLSAEKGLDTLLEAFALVVARVPGARLSIIGDGPARVALEAQCRALQLDACVRFLGHLARHEVESVAQTAWVQVVPSRWAEPFGIVAAEAMMRGTAVVASNTGGLAELVRHGETGLQVPPGRADAFAEALIPLLSDVGMAERYGARGREIALRELSDATYVENMLTCYEQVRALHRGETIA